MIDKKLVIIEGNSITGLRDLSSDEILRLDRNLEVLRGFLRHYMLIEYVRVNYKAFHGCLEKQFLSSTPYQKSLLEYPFTDFLLNLNSTLLNFLMSVRTLLDHMETNIKRSCGGDSDNFKYLKKLQSDEYDNTFSYPFMYKLRNYVQHCGMPPISFELNDSIDHDNNSIDGEFNVHFEREILLKESLVWGSVKSLLEKQPDKINVVTMVDSHFSSISNICLSYIEHDSLASIITAKEEILKLIGQSDGYYLDNYSIMKAEKDTNDSVFFNFKGIPASLLEKINNFLDWKSSFEKLTTP
jgi:hypothetical protein